jgi:hypothetical protein
MKSKVQLHMQLLQHVLELQQSQPLLRAVKKILKQSFLVSLAELLM